MSGRRFVNVEVWVRRSFVRVEGLIVSDQQINILPFHVASHESRLTVSKPGRS